MKVDNQPMATATLASANTAYGAAKSAKAPVGAKNDSVEVSASASLFQKGLEAIKEVPDVRTEAIDGIRKEFEAGTYYRDETAIASKLLQENISIP